MSHGSETRKQRGGNTGVKGRRSREGAGLGSKIRESYSKQHPPEEAIKDLEQGWNTISHEWFGTNKKSFPYNMSKWNKAPSLINKGNTELRIEKVMSRLRSK
jgi:hypothetical protein